MLSAHRIRRGIESVLTATAGTGVGYAGGAVLDAWLGTSGIAAAVAVPACLNGLVSGARGTYAWQTPGGILAFLLDSSWAIVGTTLGLLVNAYDTIRASAEYAPEFSQRQNRHVFAAGFAVRRGFATTLGNVVTNAGLNGPGPVARHRDLIERHEGLHIWQQRWFGPLFPLTYVVWGVIGGVVGLLFGLASRERRARGIRIGKLMETAAYYDNPFEYWAYRNDDRWKSNGAQPVLKWGSFRWPDPGHR